jgi:hypothetical protein
MRNRACAAGSGAALFVAMGIMGVPIVSESLQLGCYEHDRALLLALVLLVPAAGAAVGAVVGSSQRLVYGGRKVRRVHRTTSKVRSSSRALGDRHCLAQPRSGTSGVGSLPLPRIHVVNHAQDVYSGLVAGPSARL